jgi:hypothetical protein
LALLTTLTFLSGALQPASAHPNVSPGLSGSTSATVSVPTADDPELADHPDLPPQPDDFVRPEPPAGAVSTEYTYVNSPLSGTMKTTLVTVQLADKSAAETDAAVPMAAARASAAAARDFWSFASAGRVQISVVAERILHRSAARSTQSPWDITEIVTRELGWSQTSYSALVLFIPGSYLQNGAAGMTYSNGGIGGRILMPQNSRLTTPVLTHEFGHTLGMDHANSLQCGSGVSDVASGPYGGFADPSCSVKTYGDNVDLMGISHYDYMPMISASLWDMGRFGDGQEIANLGTINAARTVTLKPWAAPGSGRAVKFTDPASGEVYFVELRTPVGYDAGNAVGGNRGVKITQQAAGNSSILLPRSTLPFSGYYSNTQAWQAGSTFVTHAGTRVTIDSLSDSAASVTIRPPGIPAKGVFESATATVASSGADLVVNGWAVDPANSSSSTDAHIYVTAPDGTRTGYATRADQPRQDVNSALGISGNHGFQHSIKVQAAGTYELCAFAIAIFQNTALGCKNLSVAGTPPPIGYLDQVSTAMEGGQATLKIGGWAVDKGSPAVSIPVHIYVTNPGGGTTGYAVTAGEPRPDVNEAIGVSGSHGYSLALPLSQGGQYKVCAYGIHVTPMSEGNTLLGCRSIDAALADRPLGYLESVIFRNIGESASLDIAGWSYDPGSAAASNPVHVYVTAPDGKTTSQAVATDILRSDVNTAMKVSGSHGYRVSVAVNQVGTYRVCAYGIYVSPLSKGNSLLGCQSVTAKEAESPVGVLDSVLVESSGASAAIVASGWSLEPTNPTISNPVHVYVTNPDGKTAGYAFGTTQLRTDVNAVMSVTGIHGFRASIPISQPGTYRVCVYGIAVSPLSAGNKLLACREVKAPVAEIAVGYLDSVRVETPGGQPSLAASGWTLDPNASSASIPVHTYVTSPDGTTRSFGSTADQPRPDVNTALKVIGNHGYKTMTPISVRGTYTVCTYGIGIAALKAGNAYLGCKSISY